MAEENLPGPGLAISDKAAQRGSPPATDYGPYEVLSLLGKGGIGEVRRAQKFCISRARPPPWLPREFAEIVSGWSLALIGNAPARTGWAQTEVGRGSFDKETRREALAFAADAAAMGIECRFGTESPQVLPNGSFPRTPKEVILQTCLDPTPSLRGRQAASSQTNADRQTRVASAAPAASF